MCITIFDVKLAENKEFLIFHPMCMCFLCAKSSSLRAINHRIMCLMWTFFQWPSTLKNLVGVLTSSVVDCGFESLSGQTKDYKIGICCLSAKHTALRRKRKDWLAQNQENVSEWGGMSIRELLFQ